MKTKKNWKRHLDWTALSAALLLAAGCQSGTESREDEPKESPLAMEQAGRTEVEKPLEKPQLELVLGSASDLSAGKSLGRRHPLSDSAGAFEASGAVRYSGDADVLLLLVGPSAMTYESARLWGEGEASFAKLPGGEWGAVLPRAWIGQLLESGAQDWEGEVEIVAAGLKRRFPIRLRFSVPLPAISLSESKEIHGSELKRYLGSLAKDALDGNLVAEDFSLNNPSPFPLSVHLRFPSRGSLRQVTRIDEVKPDQCQPYPRCVPSGRFRYPTYSEGYLRVSALRLHSSLDGQTQERTLPNDWMTLTLKAGETLKVSYRLELDPRSTAWTAHVSGGTLIFNVPSVEVPGQRVLGHFRGWKLSGEVIRDVVLSAPGYSPQDLDVLLARPEEGKDEARVLTRSTADAVPVLKNAAQYHRVYGDPLSDVEWDSPSPRMVNGNQVIGVYY